jgi:hypothetical protein
MPYRCRKGLSRLLSRLDTWSDQIERWGNEGETDADRIEAGLEARILTTHEYICGRIRFCWLFPGMLNDRRES